MKFKYNCKRIKYVSQVKSIKGFDLIFDPVNLDCYMIDDELPKALHNRRAKLIVIELGKEQLLPRYMCYVFQHLKNTGFLKKVVERPQGRLGMPIITVT